MRITPTLLLALLMALPRSAASYAAYLAAPLMVFRWTSLSVLFRVLALTAFFAAILAVNSVVGMTVSPMAWMIEFGMILPLFMLALGFPFIRSFSGRKFIAMLNLTAIIGSFGSLIYYGFPFQLPYIHYLPDAYNGAYGVGGAKIVTIIGFFGLAESLSRRRGWKFRDNWLLYVALSNFIVPNFILGMVAGAFGLALFARYNKMMVLGGVALSLLVVPYILFRAESRNNAFEEYYGASPKIYAFKLVADMYVDHPQTVFLGAGLGQFGSEPAIWASPANAILGSDRAIGIPFLNSAQAHDDYVAPVLLRFKDNSYAVESSSNKPYSGVSIALVELGLPLSILLFFALYRRFWPGGANKIAQSSFVFFCVLNALDAQLDSSWMAILMIAALHARHETFAPPLADHGRESEQAHNIVPPLPALS